MKRIFTLLAILTVFTATAQKINYDQNSRWYFGLNAGATWHTSDVNTKLRLGSGFVFGKSLNMDRGRLLSFDLGVRYLYGYWEGVDDLRTTSISANTPVNNIYGSIGSFQQNFLSEQHAGDIELALHFNRLRERTGWDPYIFGAIGFTAHQTFGDLYTFDSDFNQVAYDFDAGQSLSGVYRTPLEAAAENKTYNHFVWRATPSLGFGIGYYFAPRISFGIEHRTTFTLSDYYDGTVVNENNFANNYNDLYHYTNLYLKWYIKDRHRDEEEVVEEVVPEENELVEDVNKVYLPIVDFTNPNSTPTTVNTNTYTITGKVQYVAGKDNVQFSQNGQNTTAFNYNANTDVFSAQVQLIPGQNTFTLFGANQEGTDQETIIINYEREVKTPPVVEITRPIQTPHTVYQNVYTLQANVLNVASKQNIQFVVNNQSLSNFTFNAQNGVLSANLNLQLGSNYVEITAQNQDGTASDQCIIIYQRETQVQKPQVQFTNPSQSPYTHNANTFNLVASVSNVSDINNITFKVNGSVNQNFSFNANTGTFTSTVILAGGQNVYEIIASNAAGSDQDITFINYREPSKTPPVVSITNPQNSTYYTQTNYHTVVANILNISSASQINMTINGASTNNFSFNAQNSTLTANINLVEGNNVVVITATNNDGSDAKQTNIIYQKPQVEQAPIVDITVPNVSPFTTNIAQQNLMAVVYNVNSANQINVNVNGSTVNNFSYNVNTHQLQMNVNLIEGANVVTITATNSAGSDYETQTILYRKPTTQTPPVVTIVDPIQSPYTTFNSSYLVQAHIQHINGAQDITVKINGISTQNFNYLSSNQQLSINAGLNLGSNTVQITATNSAGQDTETTTIIYKRQTSATPPVVHITDPATNITVSSSQYNLSAIVQNVNNSSNIDLVINGVGVNNFNYDENTLTLNHTLNFSTPGVYTVLIVANNDAGSESDNVNITYQPVAQQKLPEVIYLQPTNNITVNTPAYTLKAKVLHVDTKSQITLTRNGQTVSANLYSFNTAGKELQFNHNLEPGNNIYKITATNSAGSAEENISIVYRPVVEECDLPEIKLVSPATKSISTQASAMDITLNIQHVTLSRQIQLKVNGVVKSFSYVNGTFKSKVYLTEGSNDIQVIAANECGQTKENITVDYKAPEKPCYKPTITSRQSSNFTTQSTGINFAAQVNNVTGANMIKVMVNNVNHTFTYDAGSKQLMVKINNLKLGANTIKVMANNDCGGVEKTFTVIREACVNPIINLKSNPSEGKTQESEVTISGSILNVDSRADLNVTLNGRAVIFSFSPSNGVFSTKQKLNVGKNSIKITAKNNCGQLTKTFNFSYEQKVTVQKPTLTLIYPATQKFVTEQANQTIKVRSTNVKSAADIQVKVNGVNTPFKFNVQAQHISFNTTLKVGSNTVSITAANASGSATLLAELIYKVKPQEPKPVITILNPDATPEVLNIPGRVLLQANVANIISASQVKVYFNGKLYSNYTAELNNGVLQINTTVSMTSNQSDVKIKIVATNSGGTASKTQEITLVQTKINPTNTEEGGRTPVVLPRGGRR